jgi:uncharacterized OsmC-like protein
MSEHNTFSLSVELLEDFVFKVDFDEFGYIITDEAPPLGEGEGPNPARLVGAAVANCLCASFLFALKKKKQVLPSIDAAVEGKLGKVDGFWRIVSINVAITADTDAVDKEMLETALQQFEDFCIVTQSIRQGIPIQVELKNQHGQNLFSSH